MLEDDCTNEIYTLGYCKCMYVCTVCVYVCMYVCIRFHAYLCMHGNVCINLSIFYYLKKFMYVCICMYVCMYVCADLGVVSFGPGVLPSGNQLGDQVRSLLRIISILTVSRY